MDTEVLETSLYTIKEAARLLQVPSQSLRRWLDGYRFGAESFAPVIRVEPTGSDEVTWAEFVEAGFLREYRSRKVPLQRMRPFIAKMREESGVTFPLAHFKPMVDPARNPVVWLKDVQDEVGLEEALAVVNMVTGELAWGKPMEEFLDKVDFDKQGIAQRMHPLGSKRSRVVIDPRVTFGIPQIKGLRTELLAEAYATGEAKEAVAQTYGLTVDEVDDAVRWELTIGGFTGIAA